MTVKAHSGLVAISIFVTSHFESSTIFVRILSSLPGYDIMDWHSQNCGIERHEYDG